MASSSSSRSSGKGCRSGVEGFKMNHLLKFVLCYIVFFDLQIGVFQQLLLSFMGWNAAFRATHLSSILETVAWIFPMELPLLLIGVAYALTYRFPLLFKRLFLTA